MAVVGKPSGEGASAITQKTLSNLDSGTAVLIIGTGQSNFLGLGAISDPGYTLTSKIFVRGNGNIFSFDYDGVWETMQFGVNINNPQIHPSHNVGSPSFYLANLLETAYPGLNFYFLEVALGGKGFESGAGELASTNTNVNSLRRVFFERFLNRALPSIPEEVRNKEVYAAFDFIQGEQDGTDSGWAASYKEQLTYFLGEIDSYVEDIPKHIVRLNSAVNQVTIPSYLGIRQAQTELAEEQEHTHLVDIDHIALDTDGVHYTAAGYQSIASALFASIQSRKLTRIFSND